MNGCASLVSGCKHGRHCRGPPKAGCGSNGAGRDPRPPQRSFKRPRKRHPQALVRQQKKLVSQKASAAKKKKIILA